MWHFVKKEIESMHIENEDQKEDILQEFYNKYCFHLRYQDLSTEII